MRIEKNIEVIEATLEYSKIQDLSMLIKTKLSLTVVLTSLLSYLIACKGDVDITTLSLLFLGGFLITASANAINEVLEKDYDLLMKRTSMRPLATGRMKISDAVLFAGITCLIGVSMLAMINPLTSLLGMLSFVLYAFVYTPLKRYSTLAVAIGAIPGALPVLIGSTAESGILTGLGIGLFAIQFLWQFPHFWAIGFLAFEDYLKAGYKLLPEDGAGGIDKSVGLYSTAYSILIIPILIYLLMFENISQLAFTLGIILSLIYSYYSFGFFKGMDKESARKLMFCSFFYMPIILLTLLFL